MNLMHDPSQIPGGSSDSGNGPQQMSLMGGIAHSSDLPEADQFDIDSGGTSSKLLNQGTLLLVVVTLLAAGAIYLMHISQSDLSDTESARQVEARIEEALAKLTKVEALNPDDPLLKKNLNALFQDTNTIIDMFSADPTQNQVPVDFLKKNPFMLTMPRAQVAEGVTPVANNTAREEERRKRQLDDEFSRMQLQSVIGGRIPVAVIDDEMAREGQRLGSFTVKKIHPMGVDLVADGRTFSLQMQDSPNKPKRR